MKKILIIGLWSGLMLTQVSLQAQGMKKAGDLHQRVVRLAVDELGRFSEGLCAVRKGEDWGFVNAQGQMVIPFGRYRFQRPSFRETLSGYDETKPKTSPYFQEGLCPVYAPAFGDKQVGFINLKGELVIPYRYYKASHFYGGTAWVVVPSEDPEAMKPYQTLEIDKKGRVLAELFDEARLLRKDRIMVQAGFRTEKYCLARQQGPAGTRFLYLDKSGQAPMKGRYLQAHPFSEGLAAVQVQIKGKGDFWGFIDEKGKWAIPPEMKHEPTDFNHGMAIVKKVSEGKTEFQFIDKKGKLIFQSPEKGQYYFTADRRVVREGKALEFRGGEVKTLPSYRWREEGRTMETENYVMKLLPDGACLTFIWRNRRNYYGLLGADHFPEILPVFDQLEASEPQAPLYGRIGDREGFVNRQGLFIILRE